jgi:hypothetical protein
MTSHSYLHTHYLISSFGQTTATALSRLLSGEISHDQVTRFLASPAKTSADLWRVVKPLVRQIENIETFSTISSTFSCMPVYKEELDAAQSHGGGAAE